MRVTSTILRPSVKETRPEDALPEKLNSGGFRPFPFCDETKRDRNSEFLFAFAAGLSDLAYAPAAYLQSVLEQEGASAISMISPAPSAGLDPTFAVAFILDRRGWLAVRGSDDGNDWAENVRMIPFYHLGFNGIWKSIRARVEAWIEEHRSEFDTLIFTGHSLGGAVTTLAARHCSQQQLPIEAVITFGAPRVGSPRFADSYNAKIVEPGSKKLGDITYRFVNLNDPVGEVPPWLMGFCHVGSPELHETPAVGISTAPGTTWSGMINLTRLERICLALDQSIVDASQGITCLTLPFLMPVKLGLQAFQNRDYHSMSVYASRIQYEIGFKNKLPNMPRATAVRTSGRAKAVIAFAILVLLLGLGLAFVFPYILMGPHAFLLIPLAYVPLLINILSGPT